MARKIFILGIFVMAAALGVLGYQGLTYYIYGSWPPVSFGYVWNLLIGELPSPAWPWAKALIRWLASVPIVAVGIALSYVLLLCSDALRGPARQQSR